MSGYSVIPDKKAPVPPPGPAAQVLQSERLARALPGLRHGFTFALARMDDAALGAELTARLGLGGSPWLLDQPHGAGILDLGAPPYRGAPIPRGPDRVPVTGYDGSMARLGSPNGAAGAGAPTGPTLVIKAADCVTVLAVHSASGAYAALHAGWRGVAAGILPRLLTLWRERGDDLGAVTLAFGPHIRSCCFEVREDCLARFSAADLAGAVETRSGSTTLDLERVLRTQAEAFGISAGRIDALPYCTRCTQVDGAHPFASHRRAQQEGRPAGRNLAYIGPAG
jgi:copper oxidase (laccase) domain-containing protein